MNNNTLRHKYFFGLIILFLSMLFFCIEAKAESDFSKDGGQFSLSDNSAVTLGGELLLRNEIWDWFGDVGDSYSFQFGRARFNVKANYKNIDIFVQPQFVGMIGLPDDAMQPPPRGPSGMGALYYLHNDEKSPVSAGFHQAYMGFNDLIYDTTDITLGRFAYASGLEHLRKSDGKKFNTLKTLRLGDRMISSFEWSAFARSFDGAKAHYRLKDNLDLTATWMYPTQGGWEKDFNQSLEDVRITSLALSIPKDRLLSGGEFGFFAYNYLDDRNCSQRVGNCSEKIAPAVDLDISMVGFHLIGLSDLGKGQVDYLLWGGYQWGDWYEMDHSAYALAAETGYQWSTVPMKPWFRMGYFLGSGDDNPNDNTHGTFFQMSPGTRKYQLFPYYDLQNIEYVFAQLFLFPRKDLKVRLDYTMSYLAESNDLWYMGTGPTKKEGNIFGYLGRPSMGDDELAQDISVMFIYEPDPQLAFNLFYSHVWGGDVISNIYTENDNADYFSIETTLKF